jgi:hypothetical protein
MRSLLQRWAFAWRMAYSCLYVQLAAYQELKVPVPAATVSTWTIRYTTADSTWRQGRYADLGMAQMNARLAAHAEMMAEVEPY